MPSEQEKLDFAKRLRFALAKEEPLIKGPTRLANQFNLRYKGNGISPQTVDKWLKGRSIPTADKIDTLANWLQVDVHWLHYGPPPKAPMENAPKTPYHYLAAPEILGLASKISALPQRQRYLVEELIEQFYTSTKP